MATALTVEFTTEAKEWLARNVQPLLSNNRKRIAFRCEVDERELILVADSLGKSTPTYQILDDDGDDILDLPGKPLSVSAAPDNVNVFEDLMAGKEISFPEEAEVKQIPVMKEIEAPAEVSFEPTPKSVAFASEEAPGLIPMPENKKKGRSKKTPADKPAPKPFRERVLEKLCAELRVAIPPPEVMFRQCTNTPGVVLLPFSDLAAMNHPGTLIQTAKGDFAKGLAEVVHTHRDNHIRNVLNLSAEIDTNRVLALVGALLRSGRLIDAPEGCVITDEFPHSATLNLDGTLPEEFDPKAIQIWAGRHRSLALAFIYGTDVKIPVAVRDLTYKEAAENCVSSNMVRSIGKREQIHYEAVMRSLTMGDDPEQQYESLKGDKKKIANFVSFHTTVSPDSDLFYRPRYLKVGDKRTVHNITTPFYRSAIEFALSGSGMNRATTLDNKTTKIIDMIVESLDHLFMRFTEEFSLDAERKLVWTYYSAGAYGILLGEKLLPFINGTRKGNGPSEAAEAVLKMVLGLFRKEDEAKSLLTEKPPAQLSNILTLYDGDNSSEETEQFGIMS